MHIVDADVTAWLETTKLPSGLTLDAALESQLATETFAELGSQFDTSTWQDDQSTPSLVRHILAMRYAAWHYDKVYADDDSGNGNSYADRLRARANVLMAGILSGALDVPDATSLSTDGSGPSFYPNDASSSATSSFLGAGSDYLGDGVSGGALTDTSVGPAAFSMGVQW